MVNKKGGITLYWVLMLPMFLFLALLLFEAAIIVYSKQTVDRFMGSAAQAALATARLIPQGTPQVIDGTNQVSRITVDLSNIAIQIDPITAKKAAVEILKKNLTNAGWGTSVNATNPYVTLDINNIIAYTINSRRTDTIIFSKQLDRPRSTANDQDMYVIRGKIYVKAPLMASFFNTVFNGKLGISQRLELPVEGKAEIRYRVANNVNNEFQPIKLP